MSFAPDPRLQAIFESVFGSDFEVLSADDGPHNLPEWDSASHLTLILTIEDAFGVRFETSEIPNLTTVGKIQDRLPIEG